MADYNVAIFLPQGASFAKLVGTLKGLQDNISLSKNIDTYYKNGMSFYLNLGGNDEGYTFRFDPNQPFILIPETKERDIYEKITKNLTYEKVHALRDVKNVRIEDIVGKIVIEGQIGIPRGVSKIPDILKVYNLSQVNLPYSYERGSLEEKILSDISIVITNPNGLLVKIY